MTHPYVAEARKADVGHSPAEGLLVGHAMTRAATPTPSPSTSAPWQAYHPFCWQPKGYRLCRYLNWDRDQRLNRSIDVYLYIGRTDRYYQGISCGRIPSF